LSIIEVALKGSADVLGDDACDQVVPSMTTAELQDSSGAPRWNLPSTGRSKLSASAPSLKVLRELRMQLLEFTLNTNDILDCAPSHTFLSPLNSSKSIRSKLMSIFQIVLLHRSATLEDVETEKKHYTARKRNARSGKCVIMFLHNFYFKF
jgi:hypothetical protein